jgi:hypothetical protein
MVSFSILQVMPMVSFSILQVMPKVSLLAHRMLTQDQSCGDGGTGSVSVAVSTKTDA